MPEPPLVPEAPLWMDLLLPDVDVASPEDQHTTRLADLACSIGARSPALHPNGRPSTKLNNSTNIADDRSHRRHTQQREHATETNKTEGQRQRRTSDSRGNRRSDIMLANLSYTKAKTFTSNVCLVGNVTRTPRTAIYRR